MSANPWMKFYPQDWRADEKLRMCSLGARGLWIEILAIMHRSERYGQLLIGGRIPTDAQLAVQVGASPSEVTALLSELSDADVFSRSGSGVIYSRRMTRDHKKAENARKNGKKGGNPKLSASEGKETGNSAPLNQQDNLPDKGGVKPQKPEARSQTLDARDSLPPTPAGADGQEQEKGKKYEFEGRTIRLNKRDFDQWAQSYNAIPDLRAELQSLDDWLQGPSITDAKRKGWFIAVSGMLGRKHSERLDAQRSADGEREAFLRRHPERSFDEAEARAMMTDAEFERWKAKQPKEGAKS